MKTTVTLAFLSLVLCSDSGALADTFGIVGTTFDVEFVTVGDPGNLDDTTIPLPAKPDPVGAVATSCQRSPTSLVLVRRIEGNPAISAKWTLWLGSLLGAGVYVAGKIGTEGEPVFDFLQQIPFMMKAFYLLCACVLMQVVFSLIWPAGERERSSKLYWSSPLEPLREKGWPGIGNYKLLSVLLLGGMAVLYYLFR